MFFSLLFVALKIICFKCNLKIAYWLLNIFYPMV